MSQSKRLLRVELPVCPEEGCEHVGKIPGNSFQGKPSCVGPTEKRHPKRTMEMRTFKEVRS